MSTIQDILGPFHSAICKEETETRNRLVEAGVSEEALAAMARIHKNYQKSGYEYLFYRIAQLVKAIFGYSDWQIATRELRSHVAVDVLQNISRDHLFDKASYVTFSPFINEVNNWTRTDRVVDRILYALIGKEKPLPEEPTLATTTEGMIKQYEKSLSAGSKYVEWAIRSDYAKKRYEVHKALQIENEMPHTRGVRPVDMRLYHKLLRMSLEEEKNINETLAIEKEHELVDKRRNLLGSLNTYWNTTFPDENSSTTDMYELGFNAIFFAHLSSPLVATIELSIATRIGKNDSHPVHLSPREKEFLALFLSDWKKSGKESHLARLFANRGKTIIAKMVSSFLAGKEDAFEETLSSPLVYNPEE